MVHQSIIIVGGGIAGLAAGCYARMNGYSAKIFELHTQPGGLCTTWNRKGYRFDGCIHWLVGSGKKSAFYDVWRELGALQGRKIIDHEEFTRVVAPDGRILKIYTDIDRLEKHLLELSPADEKVIRELTGLVRTLSRSETPIGKPRELMGLLDNLKLLPAMPAMMQMFGKYGKTTVKSFTDRFTDPFLRDSLNLVFGMDNFPLLGLAYTLSWMNNRAAGYPIGGSLEFSRAIEQRYRGLGGEIFYGQKVTRVLVENDRAVGVRLEDGSEHRADLVISAADGYATIFEMLGGQYINDEIRGYYEKMPIFEPLVQVSLGINRDFSGQPEHITYALETPLELAGETQKALTVRHYSYDPTMAPAGKTVAVVMLASHYKYWKDLMEIDRERYDAEKQFIAETLIAQLEQRYPGIQQQIEVVDVATPLTFKRYTNNWQGSYEGWAMTVEAMNMSTVGKGMDKTLPGLENFYMIGQWVEPGGGLPTAALSARNLIQIICHKDKKHFITRITEE